VLQNAIQYNEFIFFERSTVCTHIRNAGENSKKCTRKIKKYYISSTRSRSFSTADIIADVLFWKTFVFLYYYRNNNSTTATTTTTTAAAAAAIIATVHYRCSLFCLDVQA